LDKIKGEFVDIIQWTDDTRDTVVWRFPRYENQIKMGARLTVRESQVAVFVSEGQLADVFQPGMYALETANLPVLSTLKGWALASAARSAQRSTSSTRASSPTRSGARRTPS